MSRLETPVLLLRESSWQNKNGRIMPPTPFISRKKKGKKRRKEEHDRANATWLIA